MQNPTPNVHLFNTLTRQKEKFVPIKEGEVKMYTCGLTVWDYGHVGNFRTFIFEDLLRRWLEYRRFKVTQVMNITDVDDRTVNASNRQGVSLNEHTRQYIDAFFQDLETLNIEKAEHYPRATDHIPEMVALIQKLLQKGYAYKGEDNSIYYGISKFKDYGKLSKFKVEELKAGARVKVDDYEKAEAKDFALWKAWTPEDGRIFWETQIGKGRPGWHIECSAMSMKYLGETFDIHTGGVDNIFPHHENEIAQSEAATGRKFVNCWLHSEHLLVEGKRMGKRYGNYYTVRDLTKLGHSPKAIRYLLMSTHYRQQLNFTFESLEAAKNAIERLTNFTFRLLDTDGKTCGEELTRIVSRVEQEFGNAMDDDLNISVALAALFDFIREANTLLDNNKVSREEAKQLYNLMQNFDKVLGIIGEIQKEEKLTKEAEGLIRKREEARKTKDWKTADQIRQQLKEMGIEIEDTAQGLKWRTTKR